MFNVNGWEMALIVVAFLLLFGPEKLPEVAMQLGKFVRELREASASATAEITRELQRAAAENPEAATDIRSIGDQARRFLQNTSDAVHNTVTQAYQETAAVVSAPPAVEPWGTVEPEAPETSAPPTSAPADHDPEVEAILADVQRQVGAAGSDTVRSDP